MADYLGMGIRAIRELLDQQLAAPWREVEARISESQWPTLPIRIQPHVLTRARHYLEREGDLVPVSHLTLGNREVELVRTGNTHRRQTALMAAIRRKAVLYGRYRAWAEGPLSTDYPSGVTGLAGERVLAQAIRSNLNGIAPLQDEGEVRSILDLKLKGGSYDDAAALFAMNDGAVETVLLPFEMKNVRRWIYPDDPETHKFLYRSAYLQQERPDALICPVFVGRRRNAKTWLMAQDLGFYSIQTRLHYVLKTSRIRLKAFEEVRLGLDFSDLTQEDESPRIRKVIDKSLRRDALATAIRWRSHGSQFLEHYDYLRGNLGYGERRQAITDLQDAALELPDPGKPWLIVDGPEGDATDW